MCDEGAKLENNDFDNVMQENQSCGFPTRYDTNQPVKSPKQARS